MDHGSLHIPDAVQALPESLKLLIFQQATCFLSLSYFFSILLTSIATQRERQIALGVSCSNLTPNRESISSVTGSLSILPLPESLSHMQSDTYS